MNLNELAEAKGFTPDELEKFGLHDGVDASGESAVVMPVLDLTGEPYRECFRSSAQDGEGFSYDKQKDKPNVPYGLWRPVPVDKYLYIVEGQSDCWALWTAGIPALGIPGATSTNCLLVEHVLPAKAIIVVREPDEAGHRFPFRVSQRLYDQSYAGEVYSVSLPGFKDPREAFKASREGFREVLSQAWANRTLLDKPKPYEVAPPPVTTFDDVEEMTTAFEEDSSIVHNIIEGLLPEKGFMIVAAKKKVGKCLGKGTPVLLYSGQVKPVEEIIAGDLLMGPDSRPREVLSTTFGVGPLYRIEQARSESYVVNEHHILSVCERRRNGDEPFNISVKEFLSQDKTFHKLVMGWKTGVDFQEKQKLPLDPYFLGAWLGDGHAGKPAITTADSEVAQYCEEYARQLGLRIRKETKPDNLASSLYFVGAKGRKNPLQETLKGLDVLDNKHIPQDYLSSPRKARLALLAGLIDTDGYNCDNKGYEITQKSQRLVNDIVFLARSLGFHAEASACKKGCQTGSIDIYYRIYISGQIEQVPVLIPRKKISPWDRSHKKVLREHISVTAVGEGEYYGFQIDGDGLFLLGDFTVTHNSVFLGNLAKAIVQGKPFLGRNVRKGTVLYGSFDEGKAITLERFEALGLRGQEGLFLWSRRGSLGKDWPTTVKAYLERFKPSVFIVDTAAKLAGVKEINSYGEWNSVFVPLHAIADELGVAVILTVHNKKEGSGFDAIAGSSGGIGGNVDTSVLLERDQQNTRTIATEQRVGVDIEKTILTMDPNTFEVSMGPEAWLQRHREVQQEILTAIQDGEYTVEEILSMVHRRTLEVKRALYAAVDCGLILCSGTGIRHDPRKYRPADLYKTRGASETYRDLQGSAGTNRDPLEETDQEYLYRVLKDGDIWQS